MITNANKTQTFIGRPLSGQVRSIAVGENGLTIVRDGFFKIPFKKSSPKFYSWNQFKSITIRTYDYFKLAFSPGGSQKTLVLKTDHETLKIDVSSTLPEIAQSQEFLTAVEVYSPLPLARQKYTRLLIARWHSWGIGAFIIILTLFPLILGFQLSGKAGLLYGSVIVVLMMSVSVIPFKKPKWLD
jgi:hypothetical protein